MSRLDRGRAYEVLRTDWRDLPPKHRETAFLDALEQCIEPDPEPHPTLKRDLRAAIDPSLQTVYLILASWCIVGAILRIFIQINHGQQIDLLPFMSFAIGGYATWRYFRATPHKHQP